MSLMLAELQNLLNTLYADLPVCVCKILSAAEDTFTNDQDGKASVFRTLDDICLEKGTLVLNYIELRPISDGRFKLYLKLNKT